VSDISVLFGIKPIIDVADLAIDNVDAILVELQTYLGSSPIR
jgi:ABC-type proline/glycine betaine transport system permease subunit